MGDGIVLRRETARRTIAERFLAAATETAQTPDQEPMGFPAHMSLRSIRTGIDGSIIFSLQIPADFSPEAWAKLVHLAGYPLAVTLELINIDKEDPFA
jgi:hypothetical protein